MSNRPRNRPKGWTRSRPPEKPVHPPEFSREVRNYVEALLATGMDGREVARAGFYANEYGLDALEGEGCVAFDEPSCGDWNCIKPDHQRLSK